MFWQKSFLLALSALITSSAAVTTTGAGQTWTGYTDTLPPDAEQIGTLETSTECAAACQAATPAYQYAFTLQATATSLDCYCGNSEMAPTSAVGGVEASCLAAGEYAQYITSVKYAFQDCADGGYMSTYDSADLASCFVACGTVTPILYHNERSSFNCFCGFEIGDSYSDCSNTGYAYNSVSASASGNAQRRRRFDVLPKNRLAARSLCPDGLSACRVAPGRDAYECIDTQTELESCGGCLLGEVIPEQRRTSSAQHRFNTTTSGVDCNTLEGYLTCANGACVAF
ncbi:hypothetical protein EHS25_004302 [Saitozyma podzolica]|uniref:Protein CPL1-like domain-containing protein n=1 Tax=Saitozyma podzolica TaxID=1890683 RepID=A0A427YTW0_9TREE|nr:hypothetical protein EHS25_004302 [Saitozyma podzolica]